MWARHLYNWTEEEDKKFWDLYYEKIMENVKPKDNAIDVINNLSKNNKIYIITARWDRNNGIISQMKIRTLMMNSRINQNIKETKIERVFSWKDIASKIQEVS